MGTAFNAVFMDREGKVQSLPTTWEEVAFLIGSKTLGEGWNYLGREPMIPLEDWGTEGEENSGTESESAG